MNSVRKLCGSVFRNFLLIVFLFIFNIIFLPSSIFAQTPNLISITLNPTSLNEPMKINDTVTVGVDIDPGNSYKVTGIEVKINYSSQTLELLNTIPGDYLSLPTALQCPNCQPKIENGVYTATFVSGTGADPKTTVGRLLQLQFKAVGYGDGQVTVDATATNISGYDAQNNPVDTNLLGTVNNASYNINDTSPTIQPTIKPTVQPTTLPVNSNQASLQFQPATGTYNLNDFFYTDIKLDTRNKPVYGAKIIVTYDPSYYQTDKNAVVPITTDTKWGSPDINFISRGQIAIDFGKDQPAFTGNSTIVRITFKALKPGYVIMGFSFFQQYDNDTSNVTVVYGKRDGVNISNVLTDINNGIYVISDQNTCSQENGPCGVGVAGPSHPLGTCCNGLTCVESGNPDQGGSCQTNPIQCYTPPACFNSNPPCKIMIPDNVILCPTNPPPPPPPPSCPTRQFGDANCDGVVNDTDYRIWEYDMQFPKLPNKRADFNGDGREDMIDFEIWRRNTRGSDVCTNSGNTASMTYTEAKRIAENSNCTSEGIIRDEGREYCNANTLTWWLPFSSLSNSKPGCSPTCVVNINTKQAEINWRCTGLITPSAGQTVSDVNSTGELSTESDITDTKDVINQDGDNVSQGTNEIWMGTGGSTDRSYTGFHFKNVKIPKWAKITNARLEFQNSKKQWIALNMEIAAEDVSDAQPFTRDNPPGKRKMSFSRTKHLSNEEWIANSRISLNDMKPVIQAIIDKPDWQEGNSLNILLKGKGTSWGRKFILNTADKTLSPKLIIKYK